MHMKILVCSNIYPPKFVGGAELIAHYQNIALRAAGHEVSVFAGDSQSTSDHYEVFDDEFDGIPVRRIRLNALDFNSGNVNFCHPEVEACFESLIQQLRPDVVHFHNIVGLSVKIVRLARETGARTIVTLHDHWGFCFKNTAMKSEFEQCRDTTACHECQSHVDDGRERRIPMRMRRSFFAVSASEVDAFVSPSRYLAESYVSAGFPATRMHVIWNGIDVERFSRVSRDRSGRKVRFTFVGHFGRHKGVHTLLRALPLVSKRAMIHVNLVGDGEERREYERILATNGCGKQVRFWGKVANHNMDRVYSETDVLVLPSIWRENQPVSITEAMASGCAVIASDLGGSRELVVDGVTGFVFEAGNEAELARRLSRFLDDEALVDSMGAAGRIRMRPHSFTAQVAELVKVYKGGRHDSERAAPPAPLIICLGDRVHRDADIALELLSVYFPRRSIDVVMSEWLTVGQMKSAQVLWVVDPTVIPDQAVSLAASLGLPIVAPAAGDALAAVCLDAGCGLTYTDADEAAACLAYLLDHDEDRVLLARAAKSRHASRIAQ